MLVLEEENIRPSEESSQTPRDDYDTPWKDVSGRFFPELVQFFASDLYADIDWEAGFEMLEQELRQVLRDAETGPRRVDKVVKVRTLSGQPLYLILHVEIQVSPESGFSQRMFVYYYRLYDIYPEQVVSLALLADEEPGWEPKRYKHTQRRTHVMFGYRTVKLWEYNARWEELEKDPNPFSLVVMAHLRTKATRGNASERFRWKVELVRQLYARGYERDDVHELFRFIDWLLVLPEEMTRSFRDRVEEIDQESKMKYVTSIERLSRKEGLEEGRKEGLEEGLEEGREEGLLNGLRLAAMTQFEAKFGPLDGAILRLVKKASQEQILLWMKRILTASSLDEVLAT